MDISRDFRGDSFLKVELKALKANTKVSGCWLMDSTSVLRTKDIVGCDPQP